MKSFFSLSREDTQRYAMGTIKRELTDEEANEMEAHVVEALDKKGAYFNAFQIMGLLPSQQD